MIIQPASPNLARISGGVSIGIGLIALLWPEATAQFLAIVVGLFLLADAVFSLMAQNRGRVLTWTAAAQAAVGVLIAILLLAFPANALRIIVVMIAIWILFRAGVQLWMAYQFRDSAGVPMIVAVMGAISLIVGILLIRNPEAGIVAFSWLIGAYAIVTGTVMLVVASRSGNNPVS